jgi:hypothetical protein
VSQFDFKIPTPDPWTPKTRCEVLRARTIHAMKLGIPPQLIAKLVREATGHDDAYDAVRDESTVAAALDEIDAWIEIWSW